MFKKMFMAVGILVIGLIACGVTLSVIGANRDAPGNMAAAVAATKDLSRAWRADDLKPHFARVALDQVDFTRAQQVMNNMSALGPLQSVRTWQQTAWRTEADLGKGVTKEATIELDAIFENGDATVTVRLCNDGEQMKVLHIHINPKGAVAPKQTA